MEAPARSGVPGPGLSSTPSNVLGGVGDVGLGGQAVVVVAPDLRVHPELAQVLDQVEHEAVVVVDDQDLHQARLPSDSARSGRDSHTESLSSRRVPRLGELHPHRLGVPDQIDLRRGAPRV